MAHSSRKLPLTVQFFLQLVGTMLKLTIGIRQVALRDINRRIDRSPRVSQRMLEQPFIGLTGIEETSQSTMRGTRQPVKA